MSWSACVCGGWYLIHLHRWCRKQLALMTLRWHIWPTRPSMRIPCVDTCTRRVQTQASGNCAGSLSTRTCCFTMRMKTLPRVEARHLGCACWRAASVRGLSLRLKTTVKNRSVFKPWCGSLFLCCLLKLHSATCAMTH